MKRAQGLLETIIAIAVIVTGLVSVISLTISNLNTQRGAAMRYQAVNLAREGIELVRSMRDTNWLAGQDAWEGITRGENLVLQFDPMQNSVQLVGATLNSSDIHRCSAGEVYVQNKFDCSDPTPFSRTLSVTAHGCLEVLESDICDEINVTDPAAPVALEVSSTVEWQQGGQRRSVELNEFLYDWR